MPMPWPTPVVPSRSRSIRTSNSARAGWPVISAACLASSWRACFLLVTRRFAITLSGKIRSEISITNSFSQGRSLAAVPARIDPADVPVAPLVDHVQAAMGAVAKHHGRQICQVHAHDRLAYREHRDIRCHLRNHGRLPVHLTLFVRLILALGGEDVLPGRKGGCLGSLAVVISQAALVAAQPFRKPIGCSVEGGIGFICLPMSFQLNAAAYMRGNHGTIQMSVPRKRYRHLQRIPEVLPESPRKAFVYVRSQRVTDVQLLSLNGEDRKSTRMNSSH